MATKTENMGGNVWRHDTDRGRYYETPDGLFRSVTSRLKDVIGKEALIRWAANMEREYAIEACSELYEDLPVGGQKMSRVAFVDSLKRRMSQTRSFETKKAKAADIGSEVHKLIEWNLRKEVGHIVGPEPKLSVDGGNAFASYQEWRDRAKLKVLKVETLLWHGDPLEGSYAGTADLLCELDGKLTMLDFKTSRYIYDEYLLQCEAYAQALQWMKQGDPTHVCIVRVPKEAGQKFEIVHEQRTAGLSVGWHAALRLSRWLEERVSVREGKVEVAHAG